MIGMGDIVAGLLLAGICALAWRRRRNVGGKTWAFRVVPIGTWFLLLLSDSVQTFCFDMLLTLFAYAFVAYHGGWRLEVPRRKWLNGIWWSVHILVYFLMAFIVCVPVAGVVQMVVRFSPFATEGDWPWTKGMIDGGLPFAVEYQRQKTFCAEYDKRIRFKSGKTIGISPDTGGGGPFAVYRLMSGEYYLVDGLDFEFIRSEYRVNATNETVEVKGKYSWMLIPDGSLEVTSKSDRAVTVKTANGEVVSSKKMPIGSSLEGRRFIGMIHTSGKFVAGGHDPLRGKDDAQGEKKWYRVALPESVGFGLESRAEEGGHNREFRVAFKSGKQIGLGGWPHQTFSISEFTNGVYQLMYSSGNRHSSGCEFRLDVHKETVGVRWENAWIRVPDGTLEVIGVGSGSRRDDESKIYSVTVQTKDGEVKGEDFELISQEPMAPKPIGTIDKSGNFKLSQTHFIKSDK